VVNAVVYLVVSVSGASVLAIELLGTRVLAPFYGASLYLWSALISVTLAALSAGYAIGGRWADRGANFFRFGMLPGLAGVWIVLVPEIRGPVLGWSQTLGLRAAVLITATVLFFPPLLALGMVSPYAIRLKATRLDIVGRTAGNLYAVSTMASVLAAVTTGFVLIPNVGVNRLILCIGIALVLVAVVGLLIGRLEHKRSGLTMRNNALWGVVLLIGGVGATLLLSSRETTRKAPGVLAIAQSPYAEIRVLDRDDGRYMLIDGGAHTVADTSTWESTFSYVNVIDISRRFFDKPGRMLLVGLGGGSVVKRFVRNGWSVDAVEIDPAVVRIARKYFALRDSEARVFTEDGRRFLDTCGRTYDVVVLDAFGSSSIPFHLVTREAFTKIRDCLNARGVLAMNVESVGWYDPLVRALAATAETVFRNVLVLPIAEPPNQLGNVVLMASNRSLQLPEFPAPSYRFSREYDQTHAWDNRFAVGPGDGSILTDDLNPVDVMAERVNHVARAQLHTFFGTSHADRSE